MTQITPSELIAREPPQALDVNYIRADESGKEIDKRTIVAHKQSLRDVTKDAGIDAAQTPDDLKKVWPSILNG